jgi:starch synthase
MSRYLLSHPKINTYWQNLSLAVAEAGLLQEFHTTLGWNLETRLALMVPSSIRLALSPRNVDRMVAPSLRLHPLLEIARLASRTFGGIGGDRCSVDAVYRSLDRKVALRLPGLRGVKGVICGEDGSLNIFRQARSLGIRRIYELPIGYHEAYRRLLSEESELSPEFSELLPGTSDSEEKLARKKEEAALAEVILVPSEFVRDTLLQAGINQQRIRVVPYGAPVNIPAKNWKNSPRTPLRLLYAGGIHQRKGVSYLLSSMKQLGRSDISLTMIGSIPRSSDAISPYRDCFHHLPPSPQLTVQEEMRRHDVLVLPSLFEGLALVILEAMAAGIPVIVTKNSGALPIVRDGIDGFVIPIRSSDSLSEKICWFADNRDALVTMGENARRRAEEYSWERYREGIRRVVSEIDVITSNENTQ